MAQIAFLVTTMLVLTQVEVGDGVKRSAQPKDHRYLPRASWDYLWHNPGWLRTVGTGC